MKKIILGICTILLVSGTAFSSDKKTDAKKETTKQECKAKTCCKDKSACKPGVCKPDCKKKQ